VHNACRLTAEALQGGLVFSLRLGNLYDDNNRRGICNDGMLQAE
jgi:hypothetical protein